VAADIRIEGANKLGILSAKLKNADKSIQKSMRQRLRTAAKPLVADVKQAAAFSDTIPRSIVLEMKYSPNRAGAYIKAKRSKMPKGKEALPGLMERGSKGSGGKFIRHPVFARTTTSRLTGRSKLRNQYDRGGATWVNQPTHPFLADTVSKHADDVRRELTKILDDVERDLA
jgi:hypothetical protein